MLSLIWEAEYKSPDAKSAVISAIREAIDERCRELAGRNSARLEEVIQENEHLLMAQAYSVFLDSGGVKAHFEQLWSGVLGEILADNATTADGHR